MAHIHRVYDTDTHFIINPTTRGITNDLSEKTLLMQYDHNSERFTFEIPRYVEGHDMSLSTRIEVHFVNKSKDGKTTSADVYIVDDMQIDPDDDQFVVFSWLVSHAATQLVGSLQFLVKFICTTDGVIDYAWSTAVHSTISIAAGLDNTAGILEDNPDLVEQIVERAVSEANANADARLAVLEDRVANLEEKVAEFERTIDLLKYPYAIILDSAAFDYFNYGDGTISYAIQMYVNGGQEVFIPDLFEVNGKFIYALAEGDSVDIRNMETSTIYVATDGSHIFISMTDNGGTPLDMDGNVTITVGGNAGGGDGGYTATISMVGERGENMTWVEEDDAWDADYGDYGIKVTKADGSVQYLTTADFAEDEHQASPAYGNSLYAATVENAVSVEFKGMGFVPDVQFYDAEYDTFGPGDNPYTFSQDGEHIAVYFS